MMDFTIDGNDTVNSISMVETSTSGNKRSGSANNIRSPAMSERSQVLSPVIADNVSGKVRVLRGEKCWIVEVDEEDSLIRTISGSAQQNNDYHKRVTSSGRLGGGRRKYATNRSLLLREKARSNLQSAKMANESDARAITVGHLTSNERTINPYSKSFMLRLNKIKRERQAREAKKGDPTNVMLAREGATSLRVDTAKHTPRESSMCLHAQLSGIPAPNTYLAEKRNYASRVYMPPTLSASSTMALSQQRHLSEDYQSTLQRSLLAQAKNAGHSTVYVVDTAKEARINASVSSMLREKGQVDELLKSKLKIWVPNSKNAMHKQSVNPFPSSPSSSSKHASFYSMRKALYSFVPNNNPDSHHRFYNDDAAVKAAIRKGFTLGKWPSWKSINNNNIDYTCHVRGGYDDDNDDNDDDDDDDTAYDDYGEMLEQYNRGLEERGLLTRASFTESNNGDEDGVDDQNFDNDDGGALSAESPEGVAAVSARDAPPARASSLLGYFSSGESAMNSSSDIAVRAFNAADSSSTRADAPNNVTSPDPVASDDFDDASITHSADGDLGVLILNCMITTVLVSCSVPVDASPTKSQYESEYNPVKYVIIILKQQIKLQELLKSCTDQFAVAERDILEISVEHDGAYISGSRTVVYKRNSRISTEKNDMRQTITLQEMDKIYLYLIERKKVLGGLESGYLSLSSRGTDYARASGNGSRRKSSKKVAAPSRPASEKTSDRDSKGSATHDQLYVTKVITASTNADSSSMSAILGKNSTPRRVVHILHDPDDDYHDGSYSATYERIDKIVTTSGSSDKASSGGGALNFSNCGFEDELEGPEEEEGETTYTSVTTSVKNNISQTISTTVTTTNLDKIDSILKVKSRDSMTDEAPEDARMGALSDVGSGANDSNNASVIGSVLGVFGFSSPSPQADSDL